MTKTKACDVLLKMREKEITEKTKLLATIDDYRTKKPDRVTMEYLLGLIPVHNARIEALGDGLHLVVEIDSLD